MNGGDVFMSGTVNCHISYPLEKKEQTENILNGFLPKKVYELFSLFLSLFQMQSFSHRSTPDSHVCVLDDTPIQVLHKMSCKDRLGGRDLRSSGHVREVLSLNPSAASFSHLFVEKMSEDGLQHTHLPIKIKFLYRFIIR